MEINEYLMKLIKTAKELSELDFFGQGDLTRTEFRLLQEVKNARSRGREIISSELARKLGVTRSAISQIVTKLEKKEIIARVSSSTDRKIAYIRFTDKAISTYEKQYACANEFMKRVVAEYGEERIRSFIKETDALCAVFTKIKEEQTR